MAPIERMHWVELVTGVASLGVFLVWQWPGLVNLLSRLNPANLAAVSASSSAGVSNGSPWIIRLKRSLIPTSRIATSTRPISGSTYFTSK